MAMVLVGIPVVGLRASLASLPGSHETWTSQRTRRSSSSRTSSGGVLRNAGRLLNRGTNGDSNKKSRPAIAVAAIFDPHSLAFLADLFDPQLDPTKFAVNLDTTNAIVEEKSTWALSEDAIKNFYMGCAFVFCWGCCVFGSMNDKFYESDLYRKAGGNGTGHWIYDQEAREEAAARDEMWSEDLMKEIEGKSGEGLIAEEKEREKELV